MALDQRYYGICSWFTPGKTMREKMLFTCTANLAGIELDYNHDEGEYALLNESYRKELIQLREELKVDFPAIAINSLCQFGMSNVADELKVKEDLKNGIATAAYFSIPIVQLPSFFAGDIDSRDEFDQTCKQIQYACDIALEHEIVIGSENALDGTKQLELIERVNRKNFKIYFDCRNSWWMKGIRSAPVLLEILPHICEVHLKDGIGQEDEFSLLGEGDTGVSDILEILNSANYSGRILLENDYNQFSRQGKDPLECVKKDIEYISDRLT